MPDVPWRWTPTIPRGSAISNSRLTPRDLAAPDVLVATGLGAGFLPLAPGTWGTLLGALLWWIAFAGASPLVQVAAAATLAAGAGWLLHFLCARRRLHDDPALVLDEVAGVWVALLFVPPELPLMVAACVLFRLFDIWKPWPVSWADREVGGGLGVLLDDVVAGLLALAALHAGRWAVGAL